MIEKPLSIQEQQLLENSETWILKKNVTSKLLKLFGEINTDLNDKIHSLNHLLPEEVVASSGKISRGENYLDFPWMILDYPRCFSRDDVFAYRCLCWWAHEFSFTLHLSGKYLTSIKDLDSRLYNLKNSDIYICIAATPWNYHFNDDNYISLDLFFERHASVADAALPFLKLSKKMPIESIGNVQKTATETFQLLTETLYIK